MERQKELKHIRSSYLVYKQLSGYRVIHNWILLKVLSKTKLIIYISFLYIDRVVELYQL